MTYSTTPMTVPHYTMQGDLGGQRYFSTDPFNKMRGTHKSAP
jgi:hypothetical protein